MISGGAIQNCQMTCLLYPYQLFFFFIVDEKEVAKEAEAEEMDEDETDHSFVNTNQEHNREDHSIEVIDQDENGQGGIHSQIEDPDGNYISIFHGRNSMIISSAALDTPPAMVT